MSAVFPLPALSTPAVRVEADHNVTTMRFSRTLDERHPYARSSQAEIVPMDAPEPLSLSDRIVIGVSAMGGCFVIALLIAERVWA